MKKSKDFLFFNFSLNFSCRISKNWNAQWAAKGVYYVACPRRAIELLAGVAHISLTLSARWTLWTLSSKMCVAHEKNKAVRWVVTFTRNSTLVGKNRSSILVSIVIFLSSLRRPCQCGQSGHLAIISQSATCRCHLGRPQRTCSAGSSPTESDRQILGNSSFMPCFDTYSLETRCVSFCRPSMFPINGIAGSVKEQSAII